MRGLARLAGAALATLTCAVSTGPMVAAQGAGDSSALVLTGQTFAVEPGQPWHATFVLEGALADDVAPATTTTTTTTTVPGAAPAESAEPDLDSAVTEVRVVARRPVTDRVELAAALDGARTTVVDTLSLPLAPALATTDGTTTLTVDVPTTVDANAPGALALRRPGLYPVIVEVVVDGDVVASHQTFLERLPSQPTAAASMNVAIVAGAPDPGPDPTAEEVADGRGRLAAIAETAAAVDGPISVALPPVLLDGLADDDPELSAALRAALVGDEVLAVPADVIDPSSAVAIDAQAAFTRELLEGTDILSAALPDSPPIRSAWLAPTEISTGAATMLRNLGFRALVFAPDVYNELEGSIGGFVDTTLSIDVELGDGVSFPGLVLDASGRLLDPAALSRGTSATDAAVEIMASLVTTRRELGDELRRGAVLVAPETGIPDADVAATLAGFVAGMPEFSLAPLSALPSATDTMILDGSGPQVVTLPETAGPDLSDRAGRIDLTRVSAESSGSMMLDDTQLLEWRAELDSLLSTAVDDAEVDEVLARVSAEAEAVRDQVEAPRPFTFTPTGRESSLRLNLRNNATEPLRVLVRPSSPKLTFPSGEQVVTLAPDGVTEVVIPVEARANGTSSLEVAVLTPVFGQEVAGPIVLTARVNALTGLGQVVTGAAILVLLSWWFGHFRRRRRRRLALVGELNGALSPDVASVSPDAAEAAVAPPSAQVVEEHPAGSVADP